MAGDEEARARATLVEMQARISQGPNTTLGVAAEASPEQVRSAFLALTKQYHPARFGRMSIELQRLSNEVFLGIKFAHETMMRALGAPMRSGSGSGPRTGVNPTVTDATVRAPSGSHPALKRVTPTQPPPARAASPTPPRTMTPSTSPVPRPVTSEHTELQFGVRMGSPNPRPGTPPTTRPGTPPAARPGPPPTRASTPPQLPPRPGNYDSDTIRGAGPPRTAPPVLQRTAPVFDERAELQQAVDLMAAKNWTDARKALHALAARVPQSKQYRALLCYTRGREAQTAGRGEEAALEFQRALQIDPELTQAKAALAELLRRR